MDVFPSLCELPGPEHMEGTSMVPLLDAPDRPGKRVAFSRFHAGDSIRTDRYLYTEWADDQGNRIGRMLYDHQKGPAENENISERPDCRETVDRLAGMLRAGWREAIP